LTANYTEGGRIQQPLHKPVQRDRKLPTA